MPEPLFPTGRGGSGDPAERALRRTLAAEASAVDPGPAPRVGELDGAGRRPRRWPAALAVAAAVGVLAVASAVALGSDDPPAPVAAPSETPVATASAEPSPTQAPSATAEPSVVDSGTADPADPSGSPEPSDPATGTEPGTVVVWASVVDQRTQSGRLVPERRPVDLPVGAGTEERVQAALTLLVSTAPRDPDHYSGWYWDPADAGGTAPYDGAEPVGVQVRDDGTTVDLPAAATRAPLGSFGVLTAVDELVRTVVSNGGTAPVTVLVDGAPADLWGMVRLEEPVSPDPDLLTGGWILDPYEGQRVAAGTVTLSGTATAFEATVLWSVLDADGTTVAEGFTMAGANGEYGPWTVPVELSPGTYTAVLQAPDMAGEGDTSPPIWEATTTFTVVG